MRLKLPTIIFGMAISVVSLGMMSPRAFAANRDVSAQMTATATIKDYFNFDISLSGDVTGVEATDYVNFVTKNLSRHPNIEGRAVMFQGEEIGVIRTTINFVSTKTVNRPVDNSVVPEYFDGTIKIIFNENIDKFKNIQTNISSSFEQVRPFFDHKVDLESSVTLAGRVIGQKITPINPPNIVDFKRSVAGGVTAYHDLDKDATNHVSIYLQNAAEGPFRAGDKIRVTLPKDSPIKILGGREGEYIRNHHFNYVGVDTPKNVHGVYFTSISPSIRNNLKRLDENTIEYTILEDFPARDGVWYLDVGGAKIEVVDGRSVNASGRIGFEVSTQWLRGDQVLGEVRTGSVGFNGTNVIAKLQEKIPESVPEGSENIEKPNLEESPEREPEIQAPNTGAQSGILPILLSGVTILGAASAILWRRRG